MRDEEIEEMPPPLFNGRDKGGQARKYELKVTAAMLEAELTNDYERLLEGWMFGGAHDDDVAFIRKEVKKLRDKLLKRAKR